jgi:antitoxin YefM
MGFNLFDVWNDDRCENKRKERVEKMCRKVWLEEYNSIKETEYLLKSPKNREILLRSLKEAREGKIQERELIEEWK